MTVTEWFMAGTVIAILLADLLLYLKFGNPGTISVALYEIAKSYPLIPLLLGVVLGHIFWQVHICLA